MTSDDQKRFDEQYTAAIRVLNITMQANGIEAGPAAAAMMFSAAVQVSSDVSPELFADLAKQAFRAAKNERTRVAAADARISTIPPPEAN